MLDAREPGSGQRYRAGIDVGGTFTDVVLVEEASGDILTAKVATVPADPSRGCIPGIDTALARDGLEPGQISFTGHGTTVRQLRLAEWTDGQYFAWSCSLCDRRRASCASSGSYGSSSP